jgi:hypothetical protein
MVEETHFDPFLYLNIKIRASIKFSKKFTQRKDFQCSALFKKFATACPHSSREIINLRQ